MSERVPKHIAIIMDGNGRWAQRRNHPRVFGHVRGARRVKAVVREADRLGVKALTLFAFSTENWTRPAGELQVLWRLLRKYLLREVDELDRKNVRLRVVGEVDRLEESVREVLDPAVERLAKNTGLVLTFAVSYGSRRELVAASQRFAAECVAGRARPQDLTEAGMWKYLWTSEMGELANVDLVIRTSGEQRVSNFLLWQGAYAEYVFPPVCWPDFEARHLQESIYEFSQRDRRYGAVSSTEALQ